MRHPSHLFVSVARNVCFVAILLALLLGIGSCTTHASVSLLSVFDGIHLFSAAYWGILHRSCRTLTCTRIGRFLSLKLPGIAGRPPSFVICWRSSGGLCGDRGLFPHLLLILIWF